MMTLAKATTQQTLDALYEGALDLRGLTDGQVTVLPEQQLVTLDLDALSTLLDLVWDLVERR